jgi:PAS domain S-box-containing protein
MMQITHDEVLRRPSDSTFGHAAGAIDFEPEEPFASLTRLAARIFQLPLARITLFSTEPLQVVAVYEGTDQSVESGPSHAFSRQIVLTGSPVFVADASASPEKAGEQIGDDHSFRARAGVPFGTPEGNVNGAFVVMGRAPREWSPQDVAVLEELASLALREVQRRTALASAEARVETQAVLRQFDRLVGHSLAGVYVLQADRFIHVNSKLAEIFGYTKEEIISSRTPVDLVVEEDRPRVIENLEQRLSGEMQSIHYSFRGVRKDGGLIDVEVLGNRTEIAGEPAVVGMVLDVTDRKRATETLQRREAHFSSLLENAWDVIHELGPDGHIQYMSPSVERMLGYLPEEMVGRHAEQYVHPDDLPALRDRFEETMTRPGTLVSFEVRLRHRDGSWRTGEVQARILQQGTDPPVAIVNTHDVTEARRVEAALRESEERYRLVAHASNSAIRDWSLATGECRWSGSSCLLLRYTAAEIGSTIDWWVERIHPQDREQVINGTKGLHAAIDGVGQSWSEEYRFLRGDGEYATVLDCCHIARDERGVPVRVVGSLVDVTERKRSDDAQRFLAEASAILSEDLNLTATLSCLARLTLPTLADYCLIDLIVDGSLRRVGYAHVDPTRESMFRKDEHHSLDGDPESHPVIRVIRSQEPILVTECTEALFRTMSHDEDHYRKFVEMGLCSFMIVPLLAHGRTLGVITLAAADSGRRFGPRDLLTAQDLASRAGLAIEHATLYHQAQDAIRIREEIVGIVSHDLRNPLNTIHLNADLLLDQLTEQPAMAGEALGRIVRAATQMESMIVDLLDMSSIEAGAFLVEPAPYPVADLLAEACDMLQPLTAEKGILLECLAADRSICAEIDARQILRVFSNLVGNAIKFTPPGGEITIRASQEGSEVHFSVADTGTGIPAELIRYLFERYWQARKGDRRGAGLGLTIVRGIVEAHGGRLWVENRTDGTGAIFYFSIPIGDIALKGV